jgi:hypothetical protein
VLNHGMGTPVTSIAIVPQKQVPVCMSVMASPLLDDIPRERLLERWRMPAQLLQPGSTQPHRQAFVILGPGSGG